jgi:hypothetical protein
VVLESEEDALIAPAAAVEEVAGKHFVHIQSPRGFERREVQLGVMSHTEIAIVDGLEEGDRVRVR